MKKAYIKSPLGFLELTTEDGKSLTGLRFSKSQLTKLSQQPTSALFQQSTRQVCAYFEGRLQNFHLNLKPQGTSFQKKIWNYLLKIPFGHVCSYQDVAKGIGNKRAVRAVARAIATNPISIVVPCHRVIASNGRLSGYAWGPQRKAWLIHHEQ